MADPILTIADFDSGLAGPGRTGFSVSSQAAAAALRKLADAFESGRAQPENVHLVARAAGDEFHSTSLVLRYTEL